MPPVHPDPTASAHAVLVVPVGGREADVPLSSEVPPLGKVPLIPEVGTERAPRALEARVGVVPIKGCFAVQQKGSPDESPSFAPTIESQSQGRIRMRPER